MGHRAPSGSYQELGHIKTQLPCPERRFGASKPSGLQALAGHEVSRLGALLGVRGTGRSGNGSGKWQHRDGSCSSCVPTHGRNRLAAVKLHQHLDRAHYEWAQAESSTGKPRSGMLGLAIRTHSRPLHSLPPLLGLRLEPAR